MTCGFRNCQSRACGSTVRPDGHELAYCVAHEAIARHLPTLRSARCCTSEGCGRPQGSRSPLCKSCRPRYAAWGLDGYPVPQEAPMTESNPEAPPNPVTPKAWPATPESDVIAACALEWPVSALMVRQPNGLRYSVPSPVGASAGIGPGLNGILEQVRNGRLSWESAVSADNGLTWSTITSPEHAAAWLLAEHKRLYTIPEVPHVAVAPPPPAEPQEAADGGATLPAVDAVEPSEGDVADAPLFVGGTDSAPELVARWGQVHTAPPQPMSPDLDGLAALAARGQQPTAPGPAVAELQQQLAATRDALTRIASQLASVALWAEVEKSPAPEVDGVGLLTTRYLVDRESAASERARADLSDAVAVSQRQRADAAEEQLAAIAALLDPEDAPAYDNDDQPIPLPVRVQTALMPPSTPSAREKRLQEAVDAYSQQLSDVDDVLHWLGAYGNTPTVDRLMKVLTPEDRRNILELRAAIVREDIARLKARRLNPPPCGRMEEHAADLAAIEAKIAALDAGEVRE